MTVTVTPSMPLQRPDGEQVELCDTLTADLTIVQLVRYFGCLPCQEWLVELDRAADRLAPFRAAGAAVGGSADYQARWLQEEQGVTMPLLLDPEHRFRDAVGAAEPLGMKLLNPKGATAYARSLRAGFKPQKITRDTVRSPGVVVPDRAGKVRWSYVGRVIGDYPPLDAVIATAEDL